MLEYISERKARKKNTAINQYGGITNTLMRTRKVFGFCGECAGGIKNRLRQGLSLYPAKTGFQMV